MNAAFVRRLFAAIVAGLVFGFGLSLSGMVDPARVIGFLDLASDHWDPTLGFVFCGALAVAVPAVALQRRLARPALDDRFHLPKRTDIDRRLVLGAALFGVGWGLGGFCPGPAVAAITTGGAPVLLFVASMVAGMALWDRLLSKAGPEAGA